MSNTLSEKVVVANANGLHARPAYLLAETVSKFDCEVALVRDGERVDASSILEIITLGAAQGTELLIEASGPDAEQALTALVKLVREEFHDNETATNQ